MHENRRLWTVLASGVMDTGNALPNDLRARIFFWPNSPSSTAVKS
ncbi:flagellar biosynthesis regulator FlaF [Ruegeria sp. HKCCA6948]